VSRRDQADLNGPEARYYLEQFGKLEHFWTPSHTERAMYNLPAGAFLRFEFFQHCQVALRVSRPAFCVPFKSIFLTIDARHFATTRLLPLRSRSWTDASLLPPHTTLSFQRLCPTPSTSAISHTASPRTLCSRSSATTDVSPMSKFARIKTVGHQLSFIAVQC
jgi:hypothetical protein